MPWPAIEWSKIVLTGAKSRNDIYQAFENIYPVLQEFRKSEIVTPIPIEARVGNQGQQQQIEPNREVRQGQ